MVVSLTEMYWFISRTLGELSGNLDAQVKQAQAELQAGLDAGRLASPPPPTPNWRPPPAGPDAISPSASSPPWWSSGCCSPASAAA